MVFDRFGIAYNGKPFAKLLGEIMKTLDEKTFARATDGAGNALDHAAQAAVREAILDHKRHGRPIAIWRDGKVVILPAEEIVVPDEEPSKAA